VQKVAWLGQKRPVIIFPCEKKIIWRQRFASFPDKPRHLFRPNSRSIFDTKWIFNYSLWIIFENLVIKIRHLFLCFFFLITFHKSKFFYALFQWWTSSHCTESNIFENMREKKTVKHKFWRGEIEEKFEVQKSLEWGEGKKITLEINELKESGLERKKSRSGFGLCVSLLRTLFICGLVCLWICVFVFLCVYESACECVW